jgi:hypothetical protein
MLQDAVQCYTTALIVVFADGVSGSGEIIRKAENSVSKRAELYVQKGGVYF